jgi:hypothetical protein
LETVDLITPTKTTFAAAREVGDELGAVVTYDIGLADGCAQSGLDVLQPT